MILLNTECDTITQYAVHTAVSWAHIIAVSYDTITQYAVHMAVSWAHIIAVSYDTITQYAVHTAVSWAHIIAVSYDRLTKSNNEMSTKVLVFVIWSNFRHSFSFNDEN